MFFRYLLVAILVMSTSMSYAIISPKYKNCSQMGYTIRGDSCMFTDSIGCLLDDFNEGRCGTAYFKEKGTYCVPVGKKVWDDDACCDGLEPYLAENTAGHPKCRAKKIKEPGENEDKIMEDRGLLDQVWFRMILTFLGGFIVVQIATRIRKFTKTDR